MTLISTICVPLHLLLVFLLFGLGLHLLHLNCVGFTATHVQLVVAHAQVQDALVYAQSRGVKHKVLNLGKELNNKNDKEKTEQTLG